jgi:hypothetical protein
VQGRLHDADVIYRKALAFIRKHDLEHLPHAIKLIAGYGQLLLYWNQVDDAKLTSKKPYSLLLSRISFTAIPHINSCAKPS